MTDYTKLVEALRCNQGNGLCPYAAYKYKSKNAPICMPTRLTNDAADAIEALQARVSKLEERTKAQQERLEDYMEKQTYIDHYGNKWMTSAKDVPTAAYEHGYADGRDEAMAKMEVQNGKN